MERQVELMATHRLGLLREAVERNLFSFPLDQLNLNLLIRIRNRPLVCPKARKTDAYKQAF